MNPAMTFARNVFIGAGIWGIVVLTPLFRLVDITGRQYVPPTDYPHFFYGFLSVTMAWQIAFLMIGSDPARFRPLMIPSILEKLGYVALLVVLYGLGRIPSGDALSEFTYVVLGVVFIASFVLTRPANARAA